MIVSDESFVSTLLTVNIGENGTVTQDLEMDTLHGMVKLISTILSQLSQIS